MDNFTKMVDCPEIQDGDLRTGDQLWYLPTQEGACLIALGTSDTYMLTRSDIESQGYFWAGRDDFIKRPSIEQLMEVLIANECWFDLQCTVGNPEFLPSWSVKLMPPKGEKYIVQLCKSAQIALIQAVMHELHNKKWDGEKWTKQNSPEY